MSDTNSTQNYNDPLDDLHHPHDTFFRNIFGREENARSLLEVVIPAALLAVLDLDTLQREPDSYVNDALKKNYSDLVFSVQQRATGELTSIYLLVEHKSSPDNATRFQLLRYMVYQWERDLAKETGDGQESNKLTPIIPIVFYHGEEKWRAKHITDLFDTPTPELFAPYTPSFDYLLYDATKEDPQALQNKVVQAAAMLLVHSLSQGLVEKLGAILTLLRKATMPRQTGMEYIELFIRYIASTNQYVDENVIDITLKKNNIVQEDIMSTLVQKWREQGVVIGEQRGLLAGRRLERQRSIFQTIRKLSQRRASISDIADVVDLPAEKVKQVIDAGDAGIDLIEIDESELKG